MGKQTVAAFQQLSTAKASINIAENALKDARMSGVEQSDRMNKLVKANEQISQATIRSANTAKETADIARSTFIAGNRAWIKLDGTPEIISPLKFDETGQGQLSVKINLKNIGRSPALSVNVEAVCIADISLFMNRKLNNPLDQSECKSLRKNNYNTGTTIFPSQSITYIGGYALLVLKNELDERKSLLTSKGIKDPDFLNKTSPIISGCVDYVLQEDGSHHQTGFVYNLFGRDSKDSKIPRMINTQIPSTSIDQLWLNDYFGGGSYAD